ncbi:hypothetical protein QTP70_015559, partial [Hemibagrus guttatus]
IGQKECHDPPENRPREGTLAHVLSHFQFMAGLNTAAHFLLIARALEWASAVWDADPQVRSSFSYFAGMIRKVFEHPASGKDISVQLMELRQGSEAAADYAIWFRTPAAQSGWNDAAIWAVFRAGLNPALQTELACHLEATSLSQFVATAIQLNNLRRQHRSGTSASAASRPHMRMDFPGLGERDPEPMQLGSTNRLIGAAINLIDGALVEELGIPTSPCVPSLQITAIDSQLIGEGYLKRQTELLGFQVGLCHYERLAFYVTSSPENPVILGFPWLRHHDPQISWRKGELARWSPTYLRECLRDPVVRPCQTSCIEEANPVAHGHLPKPYADFREVFSEERAARLPTYQAWDCAIDLLPNTSLPKGRIYPLSLLESKAMEDYIEGALAASHIRPSTSPAATGFFFVSKKDGCLRPRIDYRGLYAITIRYPYPLPLVPAALEQLRGARVFTKFYEESPECLQSGPGGACQAAAAPFICETGEMQVPPVHVTFLGYVISRQGVEMDVGKVRAVTEWPAPATVRELQRFLGFANFYQRFTRNYSSVAGPLMSLLRGKPKKLTWTDQAWAAFQQLKSCFTMAPILWHPDPDRPFIVEVDASSSGLERCSPSDMANPGRFIHAALEEWRYWLEGARHPFQVLTNHRNLEYLRGAKRLNPRQARWALFFTCFVFTVSYRPGSKNGKADALSRQFEAPNKSGQPDLILPATTVLASVQWDLIKEISRAHADEPPPTGCQLHKLFVPQQFRPQVMQWVHEAPSSGHPGTRRSTQLISCRF